MSKLPQKPENGAALILVLSMLSIMSTAAIFSFDSIRLLAQRNTVEQHAAQAKLNAIAAEQLSITQMRQLIIDKTNFGQVISNELNQYEYAFEDGSVSVLAEDLSNCFNLHSVVTGSNINGHEANLEAIGAFASFLEQYEISADAALAMAAALADWQDADDVTLPFGAETGFYIDIEAPYRTPNSPIKSISELRLIRYFTPALLEELGDLICLLPEDSIASLNVNTFQARHAPLLAGVLQDQITRDNLIAIIADRPFGSFSTASDFFRASFPNENDVENSLKAPFKRYPSRVRLIIESEFISSKARLTTEVYFKANGTYDIISRKFGI